MAAVAGTLGLASSKPAKPKDFIGVGKVVAKVRKGLRHAVGKDNVRKSRVLLKNESSEGEVLGACHVRVIDTTFPCKSPFLIFRVETEEVKVRQKEWQDKEISLSLTSLPNLVDLHVHLYEDMSTFLRPRARAIVPLGPLLFPSIQDALRQLSIGGFCRSRTEFRSPETRFRLNLMPPSKRSLARSSSAPPGPDELAEKFKPAIRGVPGSGHFGNPSDVAGLGTIELAVSIELCTSTPMWQELLRPPWQPSSDGSSSKDFLQKDAEDAFKELKPKLLQQGQNRLWRCFRLPALARLVLESHILTLTSLASWVCLVLWFPLWPWPLLVWIALVANGMLDQKEKKHLWAKGDSQPPDECAYPIWEEQVGKRSVSYGATQIMQIQFVLYEMQVLLNGSATILEKLHSLASFVDPALSMLYYGLILVFCFILTVTLWLDLMRPLVAIFGVLVLAIGHIFYDAFESVQTIADRITDELRSTKFGLAAQFQSVAGFGKRKCTTDVECQQQVEEEDSIAADLQALGMQALMQLQAFFARVPADPELAHRFIASQICSSHHEVVGEAMAMRSQASKSSEVDAKRNDMVARAATVPNVLQVNSKKSDKTSEEEPKRASSMKTLENFLGEEPPSLATPLLKD